MHIKPYNGPDPRVVGGSNYQFNALDRPEIDLDEMYAGSLEARFKANSCIHDGCSGQQLIDTTFENTVEAYLPSVRSDYTRYSELPAPHDEKRINYPHRMS